MNFQEFASSLFGGRDEFEEKVIDARQVKKAQKESSGPFSGSLDVSKEKIRSKEDLQEAKVVFNETSDAEVRGFTEEWLADKKLRRGEVDERSINDKVVIEGDLKKETDDALLLEGDHFSKTTDEQFIPKSQFDEFESSAPDLSSSQREKAQDIMESRSERARRKDKRNAAPIAETFDEWKSNPSEKDLPGIDTLGSSKDFDDLF